ncbi:hypothetical protein K1719_043971 [Acacia pycnantha]|nr:hypothetical protein K1719_043971 [Acacia pycnantha]
MLTIMNSNKIFLLSFIPFLFSPSIEALVTYLYHNCSSSKTFSADSAFQSDRTTLLSSLDSANTEFYNTTVVSGGGGGVVVYGLYMCRGDIVNNPTLCHQCVVKATQRLSSECRASKEAIIWYDECMIRYSNSSFFSTINTRPRLSLLTTGDVSNQARFMRTLYDVLNKTAVEAAKPATGKKKYATGTANFSRFQTVYCVAQCTPDLTPSDCRSCLSGVIGDLEWCCNGKQGGRVMYPNCNVRYELYPFYQSEAASVSSTNTTGSQDSGKGGISSKTIVAIVVPISVAALIFIVGMCYLIKRILRNKYDSDLEGKSASDFSNLSSLQYEFATLEAATNMFSAYNILGEGGYGQVYKGVLPNGQEVAVKRLSADSRQSVVEEFKNHVEVLDKLQHKNLVRFLGFCAQERERILVYEYMANGSLDHVLFNPEMQKHLDWTKRYTIVKGIARGIQYFHEDSRLKVIHCDLKATNVLLDSDMNPKISNLGLARILLIGETEGNDHLKAGTLSYMAPEYGMHGVYSIKSDVYSFGVLLLETISGRKNYQSFHHINVAEGLLHCAWELWNDGRPLELLDPAIRESNTPNEVIRCIHIGLLCVQENPADRPSISSILLMLEYYPMTLPTPSLLGRFVDRRTDSTSLLDNEMSVSEEMGR